MESAFKRGLFHIIGGLSIFVAAIFMSRIIFLLSLSAFTVIYLCFELIRLRSSMVNDCFFKNLGPLLRTEEVSRLTGASYILVSSLLLFVFFRQEIALVALSFLIIGDAVSAIVGKYLGRRKFFYRTYEGSAACLVACLIIVFLFYIAGINISLPIMLIGAVIAAIAAAMPLRINDNLTIPLLSALAMLIVELIFKAVV